MNEQKKQIFRIVYISLMVIAISVLHYSTPTMKWQYHLIYMQIYFIPILIAAFQFGVRGGLITALAVTALYLPHVMLQWGGLLETNMMRFLQILLFNIIGYLTGLKAQKEKEEKQKLQKVAEELKNNFKKLELQSEKLAELEEQLRLSERLSVIGELTASLAHEIRNPLGAIRGAVEIIRDEVPDKMRNFEFFRILIDETKRLNEVVENYLSYSKKSSTESIIFNPEEVAESSIFIISNLARKNNIDIEFINAENPIRIKGNPGDLKQILINLLLNAVQAIGKNGTINVILKPEINTFELIVQDDGRGMEETELTEIFKPFYSISEASQLPITHPDGPSSPLPALSTPRQAGTAPYRYLKNAVKE